MDISPDILQLLTNFGALGVMMMWLVDTRAHLKLERENHQKTLDRLVECLKDCQRRVGEQVTNPRITKE